MMQAKEYGTGWLRFYIKVRFPINLIFGVFGIFTSCMQAYNLKHPALWALFAIEVGIYAFRAHVYGEMRKLTLISYTHNNALLIIESLIVLPLNALSRAATEINLPSYAFYALIAFVIWFLPNYFYFKHRLFLFRENWVLDELPKKAARDENNSKLSIINPINTDLVNTDLEAPISSEHSETNYNKERIPELDLSSLPPTMRRAFIFVEDEEWDKANEYFDKVLDEEPENAYAYLGKALAQTKVDSLDHITDKEIGRICRTKSYARALKYADGDLKELLVYWGTVKEEQSQAHPVKQSTPSPLPIPLSEKKRAKPWIIVLIVCFVALASFLGYYLKKYSDAKTHAVNGEYLTAKEDLLLPELTQLHDPQLCEFIDGGIAQSSGNCFDGYRTIKRLASENYPLAVERLPAATHLAYNEALTLYGKKQYSKAQEIFTELGSYKNSTKFLTLIKARNLAILNSSAYGLVGGKDNSEYGNLLTLIGFMDANTILIDKYYDPYLVGKWVSHDGKLYFSMDENLKVNYNLPASVKPNDWYKISNCVFYYVDDYLKMTEVFKFSPINAITIEVFSYDSMKTYRLFKQVQ